jgi:hypothetical protein
MNNYVQDSVLMMSNSIDTLMNRCSSLNGMNGCDINGDNIIRAAFQSTANGSTGPIRFTPDGERAKDSTHP